MDEELVNPAAALKMKDPDRMVRGMLLHKAGDFHSAMNVYADVLKRHPKHAYALYCMALLFEAINEPHQALTLFDQCLKIKPALTEAHFNKGVVLQWLGQFADAEASYREAIRRDPRFAPAWINLGNTLFARGAQAEAIAAYDRATELAPDSAEGVHNRSFVHLLRGDWAQGWEDYEQRWALPGHAGANQLPDTPWWTGEPLEGKRITLVHEQGVGDTLMMLRYVPGLDFLGAQVTVRIPPALASLARTSFPYAAVDAPAVAHLIGRQNEAPWPDADYVLPMMSLPHRFGTRPDTVPLRSVPYLVAPETGPRVPVTEGFRVGFVWKGSKDHKNDRNRSTALSDWLPLLTIPGVSWLCFQQEMTDAERYALSQIPSVTHAGTFADWGETAYALTQVEALVAVDTGITHLSGGLGIPTCILLSACPDFRHMMAGFGSKWYASHALFRQPKHGDWADGPGSGRSPPIGQIAARLRAIIHEHQHEEGRVTGNSPEWEQAQSGGPAGPGHPAGAPRRGPHRRDRVPGG
jgi:tetratricopeptide (TPR) repeat protein